NEKKNFNFKPYQLHYSNANNKKIIDQCNLEISSLKHKLPIFDRNVSSKKILKEKIRKALIPLEQNKDFLIYLDRVRYELDVINKLNFIDYFLIISDICQFARENKILIGPGRGSVSSSLVAYLLKITEVDPIKFNLLFERFLNPFRTSLPDIDLDIQDNRRIEIINYLIDKYGQNKVALITTFQKLQARSSIKDAARYLNYLPSQADEISKNIPINMSLNEAYKKVVKFKAIINQSPQNQELFKIATKIENLPRQIGIHAAGVVITDEPIINSVPVLLNDFIQIQFSADYLENWGLTKIDLLGLKNLTIIQEIQDLIYLDYKKTIDLKNIPLANFKTNQLLSNGYTNGIFQLESKGMIKILKQVQVNGIDDVI
ncbi:MAG: DNA polymerase III subunit alpha, partial [Mycoplasma sp.]|nr:DNA polymerase III subunit alpha [Mycoplasma sp.]